MEIKVYYNAYNNRVKTGNLYDNGGNYVFEYDKDFAGYEIDIHPYFPAYRDYQIIGANGRLPCLFWDYQPSGYNEDLLYKLSQERNVSKIPLLKQLAMHNANGMGALEFEPFLPYDVQPEELNLDVIEKNIREQKNISNLYKLSLSFNGHTPKIGAWVSGDKRKIVEKSQGDDFSQWLIKLPSSEQNPKDGLVEYVYSKMAKSAGINVSNTYLFPSKHCAGYFGSKRFDRTKEGKKHVLSAYSLMNKHYLDHSISIEDHINLTKDIAFDEVDNLMRLIIFNAKTGNDDVRGTNISFMLEKNNKWKLAPAYDLVPFSPDNVYTPKMLRKDYDKNEEDGRIYDLCEVVGYDFTKISPMIEEVENAVSDYFRLMVD